MISKFEKNKELKRIQLSIRIDERTLLRLKAVSQNFGVSKSDLAREFIEEKLNEIAKPKELNEEDSVEGYLRSILVVATATQMITLSKGGTIKVDEILKQAETNLTAGKRLKEHLKNGR